MKFWIWAFLVIGTALGMQGQAQFRGQIVFTQGGAKAAAGWNVVLTTSPNIQEF